MVYDVIFISIIIAFITNKLKEISLRHRLNASKERRLILSGGLVILYLLSSVMLPFPESLYWFIILALVFTVTLVSFDIIKMEVHRLYKLKAKDRVINILFYSMLTIFVHIYL